MNAFSSLFRLLRRKDSKTCNVLICDNSATVDMLEEHCGLLEILSDNHFTHLTLFSHKDNKSCVTVFCGLVFVDYFFFSLTFDII